MACGLPIITNQQVGAAELLPDNAHSQLAVHPSVDSLVEQLERMIVDKEYRESWIGYSKLAAESNSLEINFEKTLAVYKQAGL